MSGILTGLIVTIHVLACIALMFAILLQSGKGGGLAGAFGGGSSQTLFGGRGAAGFLSRATTVLAVIFFVTSLTLGLSASRAVGRRSLVQEEARRRATGAPAPGAGPSAPAPGASSPLGGGSAIPPNATPGTAVPPGQQAPAPGTAAPPTQQAPARNTPAPSGPATGSGTTTPPTSGSGQSPATGGQ